MTSSNVDELIKDALGLCGENKNAKNVLIKAQATIDQFDKACESGDIVNAVELFVEVLDDLSKV